MTFDPGVEHSHCLACSISSLLLFGTLYKIGQQDRMLPVYQGIFSMLSKVSLSKELRVCFFSFSFPCVGLVV